MILKTSFYLKVNLRVSIAFSNVGFSLGLKANWVFIGLLCHFYR